MRKWWSGGLFALLLVGGMSTGIAVVTSGQSGGGATAGTLVTKTTGAPEPDRADEGKGLGPPPWAHRHDASSTVHSKDQPWKNAWRRLTPAQREQKMTAFAKAHAHGMRAWADCVIAAGDDTSKRAACEKPLPPGLAKRQP